MMRLSALAGVPQYLSLRVKTACWPGEYFERTYGPVPICSSVFPRRWFGSYVSEGTMKPTCDARIDGHVTCGLLRLNVTAYLPFVLTLLRFPSSDDGVFAAASFTTVLFVTRSKENFTSAESNAEPSLKTTPWRRLHRHVLSVPTEKHLVASDGSSFDPCRKSIRCSNTFASRVNVP